MNPISWEMLWHIPHFREKCQYLMRQQAIVNIAFIGSVAHGKTTLVEKLSYTDTRRYSAESKKGYSLKIGYANFLLYACPECSAPDCFQTRRFPERSPKERKCTFHKKTEMELLSHFSVIDCPGHSALSSVMMSGAGCVDGAILLIAANEDCPQAQTQEHLAVADLAQLEIIAIVQNKMDLCADYLGHYQQIKDFVEQTVAEPATIIPTICRPDITRGVSEVCQELARFALQHAINRTTSMLLKAPSSNPQNIVNKPLKMLVVRSFDFNKADGDIKNIVGGGLGGPIVSGEMQVGSFYEIRPGIVINEDKRMKFLPLLFKIVTLKTPKSVSYAVKGGNIGLGTTLDPSLTRADRMAGQMVGTIGTLPFVFGAIEAQYFTMKGKKLKENDLVRLSVSTQTSDGMVKKVWKEKTNKSEKRVLIHLRRPVCADIETPLSIMKKDDSDSYHLIAKGILLEGSQKLERSQKYEQFLESIDADLIKQSIDLSYQTETNTDQQTFDVEMTLKPVDQEQPSLTFTNSDNHWCQWADQTDDWRLQSYDMLIESVKQEEQVIQQQTSNQKKKLKIASPQLNRDGGAHIIWSNYESVCTSITRPRDHFIKFIKAETSIEMTIKESGLRMRGRISQGQIGKLIQNYVNQYVKCKYCGSRNTDFTDHKLNYVKCNDCFSRQWEVVQLK